MQDLEPVLSMLLALAAGLLVGLEREQSRDEEEAGDKSIGGIRTFPLFALLGAIASLLSGVWVLLVAFASVATLLAVAYADDVKRNRDRGLTTESAALVTVLLGALATSRGVIEPLSRRVVVVAGLAVVVTLVLQSKPRLHALAGRLSREDLYATVKFLLVTVLVLPMLPNRTMGPLDVLNPFNIGLMVVFIAGIGFAGYVATRLLGSRRGLALTALLGSVASSTAVTLSFSGTTRKESRLAPTAAVAILLASAIMFGRILIEVAVVHGPLLRTLWPPIAVAVATCIASGVVVYKMTDAFSAEHGALKLSNPFDLGIALRFGFIFAAVLFVSRAAQIHGGSAGIYAAAALAGTTDVDAITLSSANLARSGTDPRIASTAILIGAGSNTLVKTALAWAIGGARLGRMVALGHLAALAAAAVTLSIWYSG